MSRTMTAETMAGIKKRTELEPAAAARKDRIQQYQKFIRPVKYRIA